MEDQIPQDQSTVECPVLKKPCEVNFEINIFRGADHGGVEPTKCSEFSDHDGAPTCGQDCIHTQEARKAHEKAIRSHQEELGYIGTNVIG